MKTSKLISAFALTVCTLFFLVFFTQAYYDGNLLNKKHTTKLYDYYTLDDSKTDIAVCSYKGESRELTIPEKIDGYTVRYIFTGDEKSGFFGDMTEKITKVTLPKTLYAIACECYFWDEGDKECRGVFEDCKNLKSVNFSSSLKQIHCDAFKNCTSLEEADLSETKIYNIQGFVGCSALKRVKLPKKSVIESGAFTECENLEISLKGCDALYESAFKKCRFSSEKITFGKNLYRLEGAFDNCQGIKSFSVSADNKSYKTVDGALFSKDGKTLALYPMNGSSSYTVPNGTITIAENSFSGSSVRKIKMAKSVLEILKGAFKGCKKLEEVSLSENLIVIENYAFGGCKKLKKITLPESVNFVGYNAFDSCKELKALIVNSAECRIIRQNISCTVSGYKNSTAQTMCFGNNKMTFSQIGYDRTVKGINAKNIKKTSINLSWKKVKNSDAYEIYLSKNGCDFTKKTTVKDCTAKIDGLRSGTQYFVKVRALNGKKAYPFSMTFSFFTKPKITLESAKRTKNGLALEWNSGSKAVGDVVVFVSEDKDFTFEKTQTWWERNDGKATVYADKTAKYVKIQAVASSSILTSEEYRVKPSNTMSNILKAK